MCSDPATQERRLVSLAVLCNFLLMDSYYILRPLRDTVAAVVGVDRLQQLFTATFVATLAGSAIFAMLASRIRLARLIPTLFAVWTCNLVAFAAAFHGFPDSREIAAAYFIWFSVSNLFMVSMFWSLMVDVFPPAQATRAFGCIASGGAVGAIAGPLCTRLLAGRIGLSGLLLVAATSLLPVIAILCLLIREERRRCDEGGGRHPTLDHPVPGPVLQGFRELFSSAYALNQAAFMLLMTWVGTIAYFCQTDLVARTYASTASRAETLADVDLAVNVGSAVISLLGIGRLMRRFGVTAGLMLNPLLMVAAFLVAAATPTIFLIQSLQVVRRVAQYAIARPSREVCFTVVDNGGRYKTKNVIDTVVYRFGDVSSAWLQAGLRSMGYGLSGTLAIGIAVSLAWGGVAAALGRRCRSAQRSSKPSMSSM